MHDYETHFHQKSQRSAPQPRNGPGNNENSSGDGGRGPRRQRRVLVLASSRLRLNRVTPPPPERPSAVPARLLLGLLRHLLFISGPIFAGAARS